MNCIQNNAIWKDNKGNEILAQGGCILYQEGIWYWYGPQFGGIKDYHFYNINCYTSTDLINWEKQKPVLTPSSDPTIKPEHWVGRPYVLYNAERRKYIMVMEWNSGPGQRNTLTYLESGSPLGEFRVVRREEKVPDMNGDLFTMGDLGAFQDSDGTAYILYTFDKGETNLAQAIARLNRDYTGIDTVLAEFSGEKREAASVMKRGKYYYYFTSACKGWFSSDTACRMAYGMSGPWSEPFTVKTEPVSPDSFDTQNDFFLAVHGSETTTYIYCGDRWSNFTGKGTGRYGWFPITFDEKDMPVIHGVQSWTIDVKTGIWKEIR